jgi:hypothetical protein
MILWPSSRSVFFLLRYGIIETLFRRVGQYNEYYHNIKIKKVPGIEGLNEA